jgi:integration host factor subunit alpha
MEGKTAAEHQRVARIYPPLASSSYLGENDATKVANGGELMTITKADLATLLHEKVGLNKREAADIVMAFFEEICAELERGDTVKLSGFGVFCLRNKNSRPGRNPKTGEMIPVSARRVVMFHPSHILKTLVHQRRPAVMKSDRRDRPAPREQEAEEYSVTG